MKKVHIVDYGIGNLYSVSRAIEAVGGEACLSSDFREIARADRILLPGVGAFGPCMATLRSCGLAEPVREFAASGRPFLGICVGMQLLFDYGLEFGRHEGLGLIAGHVAAIPEHDAGGARKVPHIGWAPLRMPTTGRGWQGTALEDCEPGQTSLYFVHSYNCVTDDPRTVLAEVDYEGYDVCAAVQQDNLTAFQCHPEKSGAAGLAVFRRFLAA